MIFIGHRRFEMTIKDMRLKTGLSQAKFAKLFDIPVANIQKWEQGISNPPEYVISMMERILKYEGLL